MTFSTLMALSPLDGRYANKLHALRSIFSEYGLIRFRVIVEVTWLQRLAQSGNLPELTPFSTTANQVLNNIVDNFSEQDAIRIKEIEKTINHDVKAVEYFIKEKIDGEQELKAISEFIHFACTSEDINNLAHGLMLQSAREECLVPNLDKLIHLLKTFAHQYANVPMLARTHGQAATPTTIGKEIANTAIRLDRQLKQLQSVAIMGKMNGAVGNYNAHLVAYPEVDWLQLSKLFVTELDLTWNSHTTQIEPHDYIAEIFMVLMRINTILIDFSRDMWSYIAINYFQQKSVEHEVGSSTMPHKINPIDFENAEGNFGIANALLDHMANKLPISRWQRDLSDSTVLRNMGVAMGHTLLGYQSILVGLKKIDPNLDIINTDLDQHWEVLAEPIQTLMRRYGIEQPYEKLKIFTRGKKIDKATLHKFIETLELPHDVKERLIKLTPHNYVGLAEILAKKV